MVCKLLLDLLLAIVPSTPEVRLPKTVACACRWVVAAIDAVTVEQAFDFSSYNKTKPEGTEWQVRCQG